MLNKAKCDVQDVPTICNMLCVCKTERSHAGERPSQGWTGPQLFYSTVGHGPRLCKKKCINIKINLIMLTCLLLVQLSW